MNLNGYSAVNSSLARLDEAERLRQAEASRTARRLRREAREARSASRIAELLLRRKKARTAAALAAVLPAPAPEGLVPQPRPATEPSFASEVGPAPVEP